MNTKYDECFFPLRNQVYVWIWAYEFIKDPRAHYDSSDNVGCLVGLAGRQAGARVGARVWGQKRVAGEVKL